MYQRAMNKFRMPIRMCSIFYSHVVNENKSGATLLLKQQDLPARFVCIKRIQQVHARRTGITDM